MVLWQIFLLISVLCESFGRVFQRHLLKGDNSNPVAYAVWFDFITGTLILLYAIFFSGFKLPSDISSIWLNLLALPIIYGTAVVLIFKAVASTEASVFTILFNARVILIVMIAILFLRNPFSLNQMIGTLLILGSVVIVSFKKEGLKFKKGELLTLLAGGIIALGTINDSMILKNFDTVTFTALGFLAPGFFAWAINPKSTPQILALPKSPTFPKIGILSLFFGTTYLTFNFALQSSQNVAIIAAIFPISSVLTVLIAAFFLKERDRLPLKILAAVISFIGVWLVS